jgi:hypothetical protein
MKRINTTVDNHWVSEILLEFQKAIPSNFRYFAIGSSALMSYAAKVGHCRLIKDIDLIADNKGFSKISSELVNFGFKRFTFIDKKYPFSKQLLKIAETKYYRFEKNGKSLEIMTTDMGDDPDKIMIEIYPGLKFSFPSTGLTTTSLDGVQFSAVTAEALFAIYNLTLNTIGRFVKTNIDQRYRDLENLGKVIDRRKLNEITDRIYFYLGLIKLKIPKRLMS